MSGTSPVPSPGADSLMVKFSFVTPAVAKKYGLELPEYEGIDQVVEVGPSGQRL